MTQPKLTSRQARWQELLSEFYFVLEYRADSSNHVADTLSRRADLASLGSVAALSSSAVATSIRDRARELLGPGLPRRAGQSSVILARRRPSDDQRKPLVCAKGRGPKKVTYFGMPRHFLGGASGRRMHICVGAEGLLLATDAGCYRDI
ncbi:UNVERIFIED_CONTAM: hypothetical protein Slati_2110100 [Sesamum latifolium]|uniref:Uncharacterized protein n=1 Tax=Sesamum latifolium TaxID=2727402 RepID=A0AAW2WQ05_9LAMI